MKYCVHGMGYSAVCGELATTRREGWPLCDRHANLWDSYAEAQAAAEACGCDNVDFVEFAKAVI